MFEAGYRNMIIQIKSHAKSLQQTIIPSSWFHVAVTVDTTINERVFNHYLALKLNEGNLL